MLGTFSPCALFVSICSLGELLQLIHKRSQLPTAYPVDPKRSSAQFMGSLPGNTTNMIDLSRLQEDILSIYIAGKPVITESSICVLRIAFKFKEKSSLASLQLRYVMYIPMCCIHVVHTYVYCVFLSNSVRGRSLYMYYSCSLHDYSADMETISRRLPDTFKVKAILKCVVQSVGSKHLEFEGKYFHITTRVLSSQLGLATF